MAWDGAVTGLVASAGDLDPEPELESELVLAGVDGDSSADFGLTSLAAWVRWAMEPG